MKLKIILKPFRLALIKKDLIQFLWVSYAFLLVLFIVGIGLESVFYFPAKVKMFVVYSILLIFSLWVMGLGACALFIQTNYLKKYQWSRVAQLMGEKFFPKKDSVINALQLENTMAKSSSTGLSQAFINRVTDSLVRIDHKKTFTDNPRGKITALFLLVIITVGVTGFKDTAGYSVYRWFHPQKDFEAPKPFYLRSSTGDIHLLGGDSTKITVVSSHLQPDTVSLEFTPVTPVNKNSEKIESLLLKAQIDSSGKYTFKLKDINRDYTYEAFVNADHFWQVWKEVRSPEYRIMVTDRPAIKTFTLTLIPPDYSGLEPIIQSGNQASVQGLKGSTVAILFTSNRYLAQAFLKINDAPHPLQVSGKRAEGGFLLEENGIFTIHLYDNRNITNRDPIPYHLEIIPDLYPQLSVYEPHPIIELGDDQIIPVHLDIEDDFGFSNLQIGYEIKRPAYIETDPVISVFKVPDLIPNKPKQTITLDWNLSDLMLMPEDEVHYHFELYDNDQVSGPKKSLSGNFVARLPSLEDLFFGIEKKEEHLIEDMTMNLEDLETIQKELQDLKLDMIKSNDMDWQQQQTMKNILEETKERISEFQEMAEAMESLKDAAEKHQLFTPELMEKFSELNQLVHELISEDLLSNLKNIEDVLENMNPKDMMNAINEMAENMDQIEQELDRFLDILKRIQAEQKVDEVAKRLEQLTEQQDHLDQQLWEMNNDTDPSTFIRNEQSELRIQEEFDHIQSAMKEAAGLTEEFSSSVSEAMEEMAESSLTKKTEKQIENTTSNLNQQQLESSRKSSKSALSGLSQLHEMAMNIQQQFQQETSAEMAEKFQEIMSDVLSLSKSQEDLRKKTAGTPRNSQRVKDLAGHQQILKDQLTQIMTTMMELSKETFAVTPEMGKAMGKTFAEMNESISRLADRNTTSAKNRQDLAMEGLNEAALSIHKSIQQMQSGGSASGYEQFLKQMEQMAGQQQGINNQGMQLALGQMAAGMQQSMMQQMLSQQQGVRKSLQELMEEMAQSGSKGMGDMSGIGQDMDEVIKDLKQKRYNRKTQQRQERILSRMLDSQKSMTQRGKKEERLAETASKIVKLTGPSGLPEDMGQRQTLTSEALNQAMKAGYTQEYVTMIRRYFNALSRSSMLETPSIDISNPAVNKESEND